jgi:hypothetical protein
MTRLSNNKFIVHFLGQPILWVGEFRDIDGLGDECIEGKCEFRPFCNMVYWSVFWCRWRGLGICRVLAIVSIYWVCYLDPMDVVLYCMHGIWMAWHFLLGSIHSFGDIGGSLYMMVLVLSGVITFEHSIMGEWERTSS